MRRQIREHYGGCCAYCRSAEDLTVSIFEIEHIEPRAAGGLTKFENLCFACPTCNRYKADRLMAEDPQSRAAVKPFHPQRDRWEDHFGWSVDSAEILALTPCGRAKIELLRMNRSQLVRVRRLWVEMGEHPPTFRTF
ncbi:HNH endonuclease [Anatilimnocola aggregata]|nr:HNH endonuclease [Anatilimnocola aggregata]